MTELLPDDDVDFMTSRALRFRAHAARQIALHSRDVVQLRLWLFRVGDDLACVLRDVDDETRY